MVSPERIRSEFDKTLLSPKPSIAIKLMEKTGLLNLILPELAACRGIDQKGNHKFDVFDHSVIACDFAASHTYGLEITLAALFHDLGKVQTRKYSEKAAVWTFHHHEEVSVQLAAGILARFRYSNAVTDKVLHLIKEHMFHYEDTWTDAAVRRFLAHAGVENLADLFKLRNADTFATTAEIPKQDLLAPFRSRIDYVLEKSKAITLRDLAVNGRDLVAIGIKQGRCLGLILYELLQTIMEDPELNEKDKLLGIALKLYERYSH
jgi:putative nucleotidyltransferase with HDIG domain